MNDFEDQLRAALRRKDPPLGFAQRVMARTTKPGRRPRLAWAIGAIAATVTVVSFSVSTYQQRQEEKAARQAEQALRIAAEKLNFARSQILKKTNGKDY
jgi:hypothetical protein